MMQDAFRKAGFVDVHEKEYKWPIGPWARDQKYKEAGTVNFQHWMSGMEGWAMWLLCKFGAPEPWTQEEVIVYVARLRAELKNPRFHIYERAYVFPFLGFCVVCANKGIVDGCGRGSPSLRRLRREMLRGMLLLRLRWSREWWF
jgi:hypothetical protein